MSRKIAEETVDRLKAWIAMRDRYKDYGEYRNGHKVNRANLIDEGVLKRSQLSANGNPTLRELLSSAEERWYNKPDESIESHKEAREASEKRAKRDSAEVSRLQKDLAEAQAELASLKAEKFELKAENQKLRSELGVQKAREAAVVQNYGGLSGWD